jgi:hypothetical protein
MFVFFEYTLVTSFDFSFRKCLLKKHKFNLKTFAAFTKNDDSQGFLSTHPEIICEYTINYLIALSIDTEMRDVKNIFIRNLLK